MKVTFIVENGDYWESGNCLEKLVLSGLVIKSPVPIRLFFDTTRQIGFADIIKSEFNIQATADIPDEYLNFYGAISYFPESYVREAPGKWRITRAKLLDIGLVTNSPDPNAKTIRQQIKPTT